MKRVRVTGFAVYETVEYGIPILYCPTCFIRHFDEKAKEVMNSVACSWLGGGGEETVECNLCFNEIN
jgi:cytochrome bd-type quinol oxidase subunit 2